MSEAKKRRVGRPRTPGTIPTRQTLMIEPGLYDRVERIADKWGSTRSDVVNRALREFTQRELLQSDESHVASILGDELERVLQRTVRRWGDLMVHNGLESLRLQYVLYNFLTKAGIPPSEVEKWRNDGWNFAVKEYRRRKKASEAAAEAEDAEED